MKILDQYGNPIDTRPLREPQSIGSNVWHVATEMDAHPSSGLTPRGIHSILQAAETGDLVALQDLADDMQERDGQIHSCIQQRVIAVSCRDITIVPPPNATEPERGQAADVQSMLDDAGVDLSALVTDLMDAVLKGFSGVEQWWEPEGKLMAPRLEARQQRIFTVRNATLNPQNTTPQAGQWLDPRNELRLRTASSADGEALRPYNWVIHRHKAKNGYLAKQSMARVLVWPWLLKHYSQRDFAEFLEIYGLPLRLGTYPAGASAEDKRTLLRAVTEIGHNAAGIIPSGMMIDFKEAAKGVGQPFLDQARYQDEMIAKIILSQTLTSGEGQHGTQALGNVHAGVRDMIRNADAKAVAASITRDVIWPFVQFNLGGIDPRRMPRVQIDTKDPQDVATFAAGIEKAIGLGARVPLSWAMQEMGIPEAKEGEALLEARAPEPVDPSISRPQENDRQTQARAQLRAHAMLAARAGATTAAQPESRDELDDLVDEMLGEWEPAMGGLVQPLLDATDEAIDNGESVDSFMDRLPGLLSRMDAAALQSLLTKAGFVAHVAGAAGAKV